MPEISLGTYAKMHNLPYAKLHALALDEGLPTAVYRNGIWFVDEEELPPDLESKSRKFLVSLPTQLETVLRSYTADTGFSKADVIRWALLKHLKEEGYVLNNSHAMANSQAASGAKECDTGCGASLGCGGTGFKPSRKRKQQ